MSDSDSVADSYRMKFDRLRGKRVVIVGGSSGIGFGVAEGALYSGASWVLIASSSQSKIDAAIARLPKDMGKVEGKILDARGNEDSIQAFFDALPEFNHLVWTAGSAPEGVRGTAGPSENVRLAERFAVRVFAPFYASKHAPKKMPNNADSSITLTIGSTVRKPLKGWALGTAVAGSAERLAKGLAVELAPIRVNVVSPGLVDTELWDNISEEQKHGMYEHYKKILPVKHIADPEEIAETYLYVMKTAYVTGETLNCDGGVVLV